MIIRNSKGFTPVVRAGPSRNHEEGSPDRWLDRAARDQTHRRISVPVRGQIVTRKFFDTRSHSVSFHPLVTQRVHAARREELRLPAFRGRSLFGFSSNQTPNFSTERRL